MLLINYYEYILSIYTAWGYVKYGDKKMNKIQSLLSKCSLAGSREVNKEGP